MSSLLLPQLDVWLALKLISINVSKALAAEVLYAIWTQHIHDRGANIAGPYAPAGFGPGAPGAPAPAAAWPGAPGAYQQGGVESLPEGVRYRPAGGGVGEGEKCAA